MGNKKNIFSEALSFVIIMICLLQLFVVGFQQTEGLSMYPTLEEKGVILVRRFPLESELNYGNIITCTYDHELLCKRIIGMPGDTVFIDVDDKIFINGEISEFSNEDTYANSDFCGIKVVLADDEYFVMGDNRGNSYDSRYIGPIKKKQIIGKEIAIINSWKSR